MTAEQERVKPPPDPPPVPLSALEHYAYCPRQAGLILLEDGYADDANTVRGTLMHRRVHEPGDDSRVETRLLRALPVWHDGLGLVGVCDVVEVHGARSYLPVEHKSGPYVPGGPADVQVGAQALCLEDMFGTAVRIAAVFSGTDRRRHQVTVDSALRQRVVDLTERVRAVLTDMSLPPPVADRRCRRCSLHESCMPRLLTKRQSYASAATALFTPSSEGAWGD